MEEADEILLFALRSSGAPIPEDVKSFGEFTAELLVGCVGSAMRLILEDMGEDGSGFPASLPSGMGARHRLCTAIAKSVKKLGYTGECGYNQLLYPSESDTRKLLMFIVDKMPKVDAEEDAEESLGPGAMLNRRIKQGIYAWSRKRWVPAFFTSSRGFSLTTFSPDLGEEVVPKFDANPARKKYRNGRLKLVSSQAKHWRNLGPTLLEESFSHVTEAREREEEWNRAGLDNMEEYRTAKRKAHDGLLRGAFSSHVDQDGGEDYTTLGSLNDILNSLEGGSGNTEGTALSRDAAFGQESAIDAEAERIASGEALTGQDKESEEEMMRKHQEEMDALQKQLDALNASVEGGKRDKAMCDAKALQVKSELAKLLAESEGLERSYLVKKKVLEMLPDAAENIRKLQEICSGAAQRLVKLGAEWEQHRRPSSKRSAPTRMRWASARRCAAKRWRR